jgi:S1-C subfamily serine protease
VDGRPLPADIVGKRQRGSGSGFFVNKADLVTNHHVVDGCTGITARIGAHGNWLRAILIASDAARDLAVVRVDASVTLVATLADPRARRTPVNLMIVGYPELRRLTVKPVTILGTLERPELWGKGPVFQLHAIVRHGHSGSPVIDEQGLVVGVVTKRVNPLSLYRKTGKVDDENIGLAVAATELEQFLREKEIPFLAAEAENTSRDQPVDPSTYVAQVGCWN